MPVLSATLLADLLPAGAEPVAVLDDALTYLATQRDWLGDYGAWQAAGEPVGSGLVERAVAVVINWRMKRRGMRWRRTNATAIVALRVAILNAERRGTLMQAEYDILSCGDLRFMT